MAKKETAKSQLRYDITALKEGETVLDAFPELRNYATFETHGEGENDWLLRFIVWYCDMGSEYRDMPLEDKKRECFKRAGAPAGEARRASVARWQDAGAVAMAREYVRLQGSLKWGLLLYGSEAAWQTIEKLAVPIEGEAAVSEGMTVDEAQAAAIFQAMTKGKGGEMDEAKVQTAYKTRRDNLDAMFLQVPKLEALRNELFMDDEELGIAALQNQQQSTLSSERRAESRAHLYRGDKA